jgi:hypothetical protein
MASCEDLQVKIAQLTDIVTQLATLQVQQNTTSSVNRFSFESYNFSSNESIDEYFERFQLQLKLCNIPEATWSSHLRVHMGAELNSTLLNLCYPTSVEQFDFISIKTKLTEHFINSKNKYSEAISFRKLIQKPDERILDFVTRLKAGARYCQFNDFLDYSLIIQFIHGVLRDDIRDEIVARKPDRFENCIQIALDMEATREAANLLKPTSSIPESQYKFNHESRPKV